MPESKEEMMDYDKMLDELMAEYPEAKAEAEALKDALGESMDGEDDELEMDDMDEMPELPMMPGLEDEEDDEELELEELA